MLKRNGQYATEQRTRYRGGEGTFTVETLAQPEEYYNKGRMLSRVTLPVGASVGSHKHEGEMEFFYVLSGKMRCLQEGKEYILNPGDSLVCPSGQRHAVFCEGTEPLCYMAIIIFE